MYYQIKQSTQRMEQAETLEDFYERKFEWIPDSLRKDIGHFNVFQLDPYVGRNAKPVPYRRRDYHKITFLRGNGRVHYADKIVEVQKQALVFSNPLIPYKWENTQEVQGGMFCIFNQHFFQNYTNLNQYSVFQPTGIHVFELTDNQADFVVSIFQKMLQEINSEYIYKYDVLKTQVMELLHFAMKSQTSTQLDKVKVNSSQRISALFLELLERQFPIEEIQQAIPYRSASEYAEQLNIHVNHLNRAVKEVTDKTTSQWISERILQEAKNLLKHTSWTIAQIADSLGFQEPTHFNNFFKKYSAQTPSRFRSA